MDDSVKVIRNHETQESKGFAFVEAPTGDEMQSIIRRFDRAPLEDRLLRANPAQPPKSKDARGPAPASAINRTGVAAAPVAAANAAVQPVRPPRPKRRGKERDQTPRSAFAAELAKVL